MTTGSSQTTVRKTTAGRLISTAGATRLLLGLLFLTLPAAVQAQFSNTTRNDILTIAKYTVPNSITTIGDVAFHVCANLTSVTTPENVTTIGHGAIAFCLRLTGVYFQGNAPWFSHNDIWEDFFEGSDGLTVYFGSMRRFPISKT